MSKLGTTTFKRAKNDFYPTPPKAIYYLYPHVQQIKKFSEPAVGAGDIVKQLVDRKMECVFASDIDPRGDALAYAVKKNIFDICEADLGDVEVFITNPPFPSRAKHQNPKHKVVGAGAPTMPMIMHLIQFRPCWMLLPLDISANAYFKVVSPYCRKIVVIGRLKWFNNRKKNKKGKMVDSPGSTDNFAWFLFDGKHEIGEPIAFYTGEPDKNHRHYKPADLTDICRNSRNL